VVAQESIYRADRSDEVGMGDTHTLGCPCASAGVHDASHSFRLRKSRLYKFHRLGLANLAQVSNTEDLDVLMNATEFVKNRGFGFAIIDDKSDRGGVSNDVEEGLEQLRVGEEAYAAGFVK